MPETPANAREPIRHLWTIRRDAAVDRALERRNTVTLKAADRATLDVQGLLSVDRKPARPTTGRPAPCAPAAASSGSLDGTSGVIFVTVP